MVRVFFVNFKFQSLGNVFTDGLRRAAHELGIESSNAHWQDAHLQGKIEAFAPDAVFVVHGRKFAQKRIKLNAPSAVWLVDEPYETDDTVKWSSYYDTVFVNDEVTLDKHKNAHYLPTAYDPKIHNPGNSVRDYNVGFIGGRNPTRDAALIELTYKNLLSYVVGPWQQIPILNPLCLSRLITPEECAELYKRTKIILNVFRDQTGFGFNTRKIVGTAPNPRIFEGLACGTLVVSEWRPEIERMFPALPTFHNNVELVECVSMLLNDDAKREAILKQCTVDISKHTYASRLYEALTVMKIINDSVTEPLSSVQIINTVPFGQNVISPNPFPPGYAAKLEVKPLEMSSFAWSPTMDEQVSMQSFGTVELSCEVNVPLDATLVVKIHQLEQFNSASNSYHVVYNRHGSYLAKHNKVLMRLRAPRRQWHKLVLRYVSQKIEVLIDSVVVASVIDHELEKGFCAIANKNAEVRNISVRETFLVSPKAVSTNLPSLARTAISFPKQVNAPAIPFTDMPIRNLIYHVWPVKNSMWQWNIDQLLRRIDMFNGQRIIAIVHDVKSDDPNEVVEKFNGHNCEFIVKPNDIGESNTFGLMLDRVRSTQLNEVTFYAHAKGVKYGPNATDQIRTWAELLYRFNLDDWRTVKAHLSKYPVTGAMRMMGQFDSHKRLNEWHYSGTFFWIRHALAFTRGNLEVKHFYGGVEAWPGMYFNKEDTGCIALDNLRQVLPYAPQFWVTTGNAGVKAWEYARKGYSPPATLQRPPPYRGLITPRLEQHPEEMAWFMQALLAAKPERMLTIGAKHGGLEWHVARAFREAGRSIDITTVEIDPLPQVEATFADIRASFGQKVQLIKSDSMAADLPAKLQGPYDAAFIDGHHSYYAARSDWNLVRSLGAKFIGLHDIVDSDWHAAAHCCVSRLWAEIKGSEPKTAERMVGDWGGIGCAWVDPAVVPANGPSAVQRSPKIVTAPNVAVIIGRANTVWDDLKALGEIPNAHYFVINDMVEKFPGPCTFVSLHPPKLGKWLNNRRAAGYPQPNEVWSHAKGDHVTKVLRDYTPAGSSGLFAIKVARELRFRHIVLCGVPMQANMKHIGDPSDWSNCDFFLVGFKVRIKEIAPYVRSMSGWTREQLGAPDAAFLGLEKAE